MKNTVELWSNEKRCTVEVGIGQVVFNVLFKTNMEVVEIFEDGWVKVRDNFGVDIVENPDNLCAV